MNIYDKNENTYFAASNSCDGFVSYFDRVFDENECDRVYILKGGPGVGKSTFMKKAAESATSMGLNCEYFLCSSDVSSLDGIIIKEKRCAIIDGTCPHAVEPRLSGAREIIVDLGRAWNTEGLYQHQKEIASIVKSKADCYNDAYNILHCKREIDNLIFSLIKPYILTTKLEKSTFRLCKSILKRSGPVNRPCKKVRIIKAVSSGGTVRLDSFARISSCIYFLKEPFESSGLCSMYLEKVYKNLKSAGINITVSYDALKSEKIDALYFPDTSICLMEYDEEILSHCDMALKKSRVVGLSRFVDLPSMKYLRPLRKFYCRLSENLLSLALDKLKHAGALHADLEKIYKEYTDYDTVEQITSSYLDSILKS